LFAKTTQKTPKITPFFGISIPPSALPPPAWVAFHSSPLHETPQKAPNSAFIRYFSSFVLLCDLCGEGFSSYFLRFPLFVPRCFEPTIAQTR
jgi:hypothetical protein